MHSVIYLSIKNIKVRDLTFHGSSRTESDGLDNGDKTTEECHLLKLPINNFILGKLNN